jgi:excinuclease UvrABC ATPase subunit
MNKEINKDNIEIIGASENNLKAIDVSIPKGKLNRG